MKKKGFTLIELLVVIAIIAMLLAILMPALNKVKKIASRVVCGTNLKGLGTAQTVYANDYDDEYAVQGQGGLHTWAVGDNNTTDWSVPAKIWSTAGTAGSISVGASLYLLVREADVSPKSFVCPSGNEKVYDGKNPTNLDIVQLWDFASTTYPTAGVNGPQNCVSYSYQQPYAAGASTNTGTKGRYAPDARRSAAFALMADKNPWFENPKLTRSAATSQNYASHVWKLGNDLATEITIADGSLEKYTVQVSNALPHDREGQNVLYADGHNSYETRADVGVKNDNIYVIQVPQTGTVPLLLPVRAGSVLTDKMLKTVPVSAEDSILVNDGPIAAP